MKRLLAAVAWCFLSATPGVALAKDPVPAPCERTFYTDASAVAGGDGSAAHPLRSLREALARNETLGACWLTVEMAKGRYVEIAADPILIGRRTTIVAKGERATIVGSLEITAGVRVTLQNLRLVPRRADASMKGGAPTVGIRVKKGVAPALTLRNVQIIGARGYGLVQAGGSLEAAGLEVSETTANADDPLSGAALRLSDGTKAVLALGSFRRNVRALYAAGSRTTVEANGIVVEDTGVHPAVVELLRQTGWEPRGFAAIEVEDGAKANGTLWTIERSRVAALAALRGAQLKVRGLTVRDVRAEKKDWRSSGGLGVVAIYGGVADLTRIDIRESEVCGVYVGPGDGTGLDLHHGRVTRNNIGACVKAPGYRLSRLNGDGVDFSGNDATIEGSTFPTPAPLMDF